MQKQEKRYETRLKRFWRSSKTTSSDESTGGDSPTQLRGQKLQQLQLNPVYTKPTCSLPLLQVWPSQDSPRGEADGQSFIFATNINEFSDRNESERRDSSFSDHLHARDSGIDSIQASPSPNTAAYLPGVKTQSPCGSPTPSISSTKNRRPSCALLHPDHARLLPLPLPCRSSQSPDQSSTEDLTEYLTQLKLNNNASDLNGTTAGIGRLYTASSSTTSSMTSIAGCSNKSQRTCDVWLQQERDNRDYINRRRSSTATNRLSLFDALDLECALLRAAARGSIGPYSVSSLHKLTFTQSLAFPALARGLATKQRRTGQQNPTHQSSSQESLLNTFAKVITALVLVVVSILVFLIVYKFVKT